MKSSSVAVLQRPFNSIGFGSVLEKELLTLEMPDSRDLSSFTNFFVDFLQNAQNLLSHFLGRNVPNSFVRQSSWMLQYVSHSDELIAINFWDAAKLMEVAEYEQVDQNDNDNDNQNHNHNHNHNYNDNDNGISPPDSALSTLLIYDWLSCYLWKKLKLQTNSLAYFKT